MRVDKGRVVGKLIERLRVELSRAHAAQQQSQAGATHEENRAEGEKDTRATEASYLARGQALRVEALARDLDRVLKMPVREFDESDEISVGALVSVEPEEGTSFWVLIAPAGGGERLVVDDLEFQVVTPPSPLGRSLLGLSVDDEAEMVRAGRSTVSRIASVQ